MRVIVFFDLPTITSTDRKIYRAFRKYLLNDGFLMMQESVYVRLCINKAKADLVVKDLEAKAPEKGIVQAMIVTENQFANIFYLTGSFSSNIISNTKRIVII